MRPWISWWWWRRRAEPGCNAGKVRADGALQVRLRERTGVTEKTGAHGPILHDTPPLCGISRPAGKGGLDTVLGNLNAWLGMR